MIIWLDAQLSPALAPWIQANFGVEARALRDVGLRDRAHFKLDDKWRSNLASIFTSRHALVHDANKSFHLSANEMAKLETTALISCYAGIPN